MCPGKRSEITYNASPGNRTNAGANYVVFGKRAGFNSTRELSALNGTGGFVINGVAANDQSGWSVRNAGDVNGDGRADVIIGAYAADPGGRSNAGSSYVIYGIPAPMTTTTSSSGSATSSSGSATSSSGLATSSSGLGSSTTSSGNGPDVSNVSPASQLKSGMVNLLLDSGAGMFARDVEEVVNSFVAAVRPMLGSI